MKIKKTRKNHARRSTTRNNLRFEALEDRKLFAADISFADGVLNIEGDHQQDVVTVDTIDYSSPFFDFSILKVEHGHKPKIGASVVDGVRYFLASAVDTIRFMGNAANDQFTNNTSIVSHAYGGSGADVLKGGSGNDRLFGQAGNDYLYGRDGNDRLYGGAGSDRLFGRAGNDQINSGTGVDFINGGSGNDRLVEHVSHDAGLGTTSFINFGGGTFESNPINSIEYATMYGNNDDNLLVALGFDGPVKLYGNGGDDWLMGSNQNDYISAGTGDDHIFAYDGNDQIRPGSGADEIDGGDGDDRVLANVIGDVDLDNHMLEITRSTGVELNELTDVEHATIRAITSNDVVLDAGDFTRGSVYLVGGSGNDELIGGLHGDVLSGRSGEDLIWGMGGNDRLYGGNDNDRLLGGIGEDRMYGGSGNDGMFGGLGADTIHGGAGMDRYLFQAGDTSSGYDADEDVRVTFVNTTSTTTINYNGSAIEYTARNWSDDEVKVIDEAFEVVQERTNNNTLMRTSNGTEFTYQRLGSSSSSYVAWNSGATQRFADGTFTSDSWVHQVVFHEIGHNWDNENPDWDEFKDISGWTSSDKSSDSSYSEGTTGDWWYLNSSNFARNYGKANPKEDFATSFAAYFKDYTGATYHGSSGADISAKLAFMDDFLDDLTTA